jgi:hypothetical protein
VSTVVLALCSLGFGGGAVPDEGVVASPMVEDRVESELDTGKKVRKVQWPHIYSPGWSFCLPVSTGGPGFVGSTVVLALCSLGFGGGAVPDEGVVAPPMVEDKVESELDTGKKVYQRYSGRIYTHLVGRSVFPSLQVDLDSSGRQLYSPHHPDVRQYPGSTPAFQWRRRLGTLLSCRRRNCPSLRPPRHQYHPARGSMALRWCLLWDSVVVLCLMKES